jgi:hypothetical protein
MIARCALRRRPCRELMAAQSVVSRGHLATVDGVSGRVRAMFERCAYLSLQDGPALVLHATGGAHTPTSLCPATWPPPGAAIAVGDAVAGRAGHLKVGDLVLDVRDARVWRPAGSPVVSATSLSDCGIGTEHRVALRAANERTGDLMPALERALAMRDGDGVLGCVAKLVGRGPGLTPSGDDALVGMLAVLHRLGATGPGPARLLGPAVAAHLHRTGDISAHYLSLAIAGHLGERLIALCDALARAESDDVAAAAAAVVATGATSGADALLGVVTGVRLLARTSAVGVAA